MFADSIVLSKGEGTLPPLTRDTCQLVVRAAFLPYYRPPRAEVTQIVGWFDPHTCQPRSVEQIDRVSRSELEWHAHADNCMQTDILASTVRLCFSCRPISPTPAPLPLPAPTAMRILHVSLAGVHDNVWHDGYLAHYSASGQVLSLLTIPGEARLYVPQLPRPQQGLDPAAVALPQSAHYLRLCLRAQLASFCRPHVQQGKLVLALDDTSLPAMLCVVLLSSLHDVTVNTALRPPAWTRLLQNLGVPTVLDEATLAVSTLAQLVPAASVLPIARDINSQAAIIPAKVVQDKSFSSVKIGRHAHRKR